MTNSAPGDPLLEVQGDDRNSMDLDALYREQADRLVHLATSITFDRAVAEEVVQEAFVGLHQAGSRVHNPGGYLRRSVVNLGYEEDPREILNMGPKLERPTIHQRRQRTRPNQDDAAVPSAWTPLRVLLCRFRAAARCFRFHCVQRS